MVDIVSFLNNYFVSPIFNGNGYNIYNTLVYGLILVGFIVLLDKIFKKYKFKIDSKFIVYTLPYVLMGSLFRVIEDAGIVDSYLFVTPFTYFLTFTISVCFLLITKKLIDDYKAYWGTIGIIIDIYLISLLSFPNIGSFLSVLKYFTPWVILFLIFKPKITNINFIALLSHILDATTTFVSISFFGYIEEHVIPSFLIRNYGPFSFYLAKIPVVLLAIYLIDKEKDENTRNLLKLVLIVIGLAPALRNLVRLIAGV